MNPICRQDDIPEAGCKGFCIEDKSYFAIKHNGQIVIYENRCPHLGIELNWQEDQFLDASGSLIQCSTHGALFLIENGHCVSGPCQGKNLIAIPHTSTDGFITLCP